MTSLRNVGYRIYGDFLMPSALTTYREFLESAIVSGYHVVTVEDHWKRAAGSGEPSADKVLILRHDIDTDPKTAREMWQIERDLGIVGSYYFRLSTIDVSFMADIGERSGEVGYHYEELATIAKTHHLKTRTDLIAHMPEAQALFQSNLESLRSMTRLPMRVVASHGDFVNRKLGTPNWALLADEAIRTATGVVLEVYDEAFLSRVSSRHTDSEYPRHWTPTDAAAAIKSGLPAVYVLVHPRNWQARAITNAVDDIKRLRQGLEYAIARPRRASAS